ncbi:SDH family Clp fold serine proteinase [Asaia siamensis]|uniref:SDH family Clp fold serine proteinase n=1 Tax=Asaia siamensis TaxID=110479 RepID=UPI00223107F1|nr:hypothetical protein [Asaia siamensis]
MMTESPAANSDSGDTPLKPLSFPRGTALPAQSPLFWVGQKNRYLRQLLIGDIEQITKRRLIVYFANRYSAEPEIAPPDLAYMQEILGNVRGQPVDLFLETVGGQTDATEGILSLLENSVNDLRVIVANAAKSNGTLLALSAKSIVMGATSELGPIEPSLNGIPCSVLSDPQIAHTNFPLHKLGLYALAQTKTLAKKLLQSGMMRSHELVKVEQAIEALASRNTFPSHGSVVSHKEASELGLVVEYLPPENDLWQRIWLLYCMYDHDSRSDHLSKIYETRQCSLSVASSSATSSPP